MMISPDDLNFRQADTGELALVMEIIAEAAAWLVDKGIDQWPSPPNEHWRRRIAAQVEAGEIYLAFVSNAAFASNVAFVPAAAPDGGATDLAIGTCRITWSDPYWPEVPGRAGYVHTLALADPYHGLGIGKILLSRAMDHISGLGREWVRLDCAAGNRRLRDYYERLGFTFCRQAIDRDYVAALYELSL